MIYFAIITTNYNSEQRQKEKYKNVSKTVAAGETDKN